MTRFPDIFYPENSQNINIIGDSGRLHNKNETVP
jgi:hypothetical protein